MVRVAGTDPGTSSLDVLILQDGRVAEQVRFLPEQLATDADLPVRWLRERAPFDLIAGPSGYGLPLVRVEHCTETDLRRLALVRPDEHGRSQGVSHFLGVVRSFVVSGLPVVFLPGVVHLPTVPAHRKINRIDLGTADKLCVAALALSRLDGSATFCVVELGSVFTACLVVRDGQIIDGAGGTSGPVGWGGAGAWDGEAAYLLSPLIKRDLFAGGVTDMLAGDDSLLSFRESVLRTIAGLRAVTSFERIVLSGRLLESHPGLVPELMHDLEALGRVEILSSLPGAWVKHAAQGAAMIADGLAGGEYRDIVEQLKLRAATGTALDGLRHPRADEVRHWFA